MTGSSLLLFFTLSELPCPSTSLMNRDLPDRIAEGKRAEGSRRALFLLL
ncbi:hypothetical protein [Microcoleus sp. T2B6]